VKDPVLPLKDPLAPRHSHARGGTLQGGPSRLGAVPWSGAQAVTASSAIAA
jgi:hypothetical protein